MTFVNYDETCPTGFTSFNFGTFTGSSKGACACVSNSLGYTSTYANCSDTIELTSECASDPVITSDIDLKLWRGKRLCYQRAGQAACEFDRKKQESYKYTGAAATTPWRRPRPAKDGSCPTGYQRCGEAGTSTYSESRAICFPNDVPCPLTGLKVASASTVATVIAAGYTEYLGTFDDSYELYGRRDGVSDVLPTIYIEDALAELSGGTSYDKLAYKSSDNKRGKCYNGQGKAQSVPGKFSYNNDYAAANYVNDYWEYDFNTKCSRTDGRWDIIDNNNIESHYIRNFQYLVEDCQTNRGSTDFYALQDSNYVVNNDPDIYQGGSITGSYSRVWDVDPLLYFTSAPTCAVNDAICNNVYYQTECGKYIHLAHQFERSWEDTTYGLYSQSEIYWSEDCSSEQVIYDNYGALRAVTAAQLAVVITNTFFGIIGIAMIVITVSKQRVKNVAANFVNMTTKTRVEPNQWIDYLIMVCKLAPILASLVITGASYKVWYSVGASKDCSDSTTDYTFNFLASKLPEIYNNTVSTFVLDIILLCNGTLAILQERQRERYEARNAHFDVNAQLYCLVEMPSPGGCCAGKEGTVQIACFENTYKFNVPSGYAPGQIVRLYTNGDVYTNFD